MFASATGIVLGVLLGLRHAFEPDHLTAVSTLVVEANSARRGALLGAIWGIGHTISLLVVGSVLVATGAVLPERAAAGFELAVAAMLVVLGIRSLVGAHRHHAADHVHVGRRTFARPLFVGLVHGLAGSGAIAALVFAELPTTAQRITYIALFGLGSVAGMAAASGVAGVSLRALAPTGPRRRIFGAATGALSITVGIVWAIPQLVLL